MDIRVKDDYDLYNKHTFTFKENEVNVLVGKNGSGKSTLLQSIKQSLKNKKIPVLLYDNLRDGSSSAVSKYAFYDQIELMANAMMSSEGENIFQNIGVFSSQIRLAKEEILAKKKQKQLWVLIDALDSGLSIDNIVELKKSLFPMVTDDLNKVGVTVTFIVSANTFELTKGYYCVDVKTAKNVSFLTYDDFYKFIMKK